MSCFLSIIRHVPASVWTALGCLTIFAGVFTFCWRLNRHGGSFYFDPQDLVADGNREGRKLPLSAATGTFAPLLAHYNDVTKLLITVAAASIAFGGGQSPTKGILVAKIVLAFSILYGVPFVALLLFFYDDYCQNVQAHTPFRYSLNEALGFSALICFISGYLIWAFNLG